MTETSTETSTETVQEYRPPCDVGPHVVEKKNPGAVCGQPAEWSAIIHDCHMGTPVLICSYHLMKARWTPDAGQLFALRRCSDCGQRFTTPNEALWNLQRLI